MTGSLWAGHGSIISTLWRKRRFSPWPRWLLPPEVILLYLGPSERVDFSCPTTCLQGPFHIPSPMTKKKKQYCGPEKSCFFLKISFLSCDKKQYCCPEKGCSIISIPTDPDWVPHLFPFLWAWVVHPHYNLTTQPNWQLILHTSILKMQTVCLSEMLVSAYTTKGINIQKTME